MKRRFATLVAMLLLTASLTAGTMGTTTGPASAQDPVHEADGITHTEGPVSFRITWKGVTHVTWDHWIKPTGENANSDDADARVPVDSWVVTATDSDGNAITKTIQLPPTTDEETGEGDDKVKRHTATKNVARDVVFRKADKLAFGKDYTVVIQGLDADDNELGPATSHHPAPACHAAPAGDRPHPERRGRQSERGRQLDGAGCWRDAQAVRGLAHQSRHRTRPLEDHHGEAGQEGNRHAEDRHGL